MGSLSLLLASWHLEISYLRSDLKRQTWDASASLHLGDRQLAIEGKISTVLT